MTALFVHGNPETPVIWDPLLARLERTDVECAHLPGFGRPTPPGFGATKEEYAQWLTGEVESLAKRERSRRCRRARLGWRHRDARRRPAAGTVPFVGVRRARPVPPGVRLARLRADLADAGCRRGVLRAQPRVARSRSGSRLYEGIGIPRETGEKLVAAADEEMSRCVLALYRSRRSRRWRSGVGSSERRRPCPASRSSPRTTRSCGPRTSQVRWQCHSARPWRRWRVRATGGCSGIPGQGAAKLGAFWAGLPG
jgi:hypothetical protein